jgi:DNA-binding NarL/FixJ family response regulator
MSRTPRIRLLLADDHEVVRAGIRSILKGFGDVEIIAEASSGAEAVTQVEEMEPDVVLLDMRLPDISGQEVCRRITAAGCEARVLFLTSYLEESAALEGIEAGAAGFLLKQIGREALHQAIRDVHEGRSVIPQEVAEALAVAVRSRSRQHEASSKIRSLSTQEHRIAALVAEGLLNKEIADRMGLSEKTVRNYLGHIFVKLGMNRRAQVASFFTSQHPSRD